MSDEAPKYPAIPVPQQWSKDWNNPDDGLGPLIQPLTPPSILIDRAAVCAIDRVEVMADYYAPGHDAAVFRATAALLLAKAEALAPAASLVGGAEPGSERWTEITELTGILLKMEAFDMAWPLTDGTATRLAADALCDLRVSVLSLATALATERAHREKAEADVVEVGRNIADCQRLVQEAGALLAEANRAVEESDELLTKTTARLEEEKTAAAEAECKKLEAYKELAVQDEAMQEAKNMLEDADHWMTVPATSNSDRDAVGELSRRINAFLKSKSAPAPVQGEGEEGKAAEVEKLYVAFKSTRLYLGGNGYRNSSPAPLADAQRLAAALGQDNPVGFVVHEYSPEVK